MTLPQTKTPNWHQVIELARNDTAKWLVENPPPRQIHEFQKRNGI